MVLRGLQVGQESARLVRNILEVDCAAVELGGGLAQCVHLDVELTHILVNAALPQDAIVLVRVRGLQGLLALLGLEELIL